MKLLHTSDWHLGQSLNQYERSYEHAQFLAWLLDTLETEKVDALLIAGDVFDNANPTSAAQGQLYQFLTAARQRVPHLRIVMTAGNHDSPARMEAPAPLLGLLDAHVVGQVRRTDDRIDFGKMVVPLYDAAGTVQAWCIAMPFLRPSDLPRVEAADPYQAGIAQLYAQAYATADAQRSPGQAIVALGHCHITGGQISADSERSIVIGGSESLPVGIFDPGIAYVALGHLHLAQKVGGDATRRYCGSPLPLSFSEIDYPHQVLLVTLQDGLVTEVRAQAVPRSVAMLRIPRQPAPLPAVLEALQALDVAALPGCADIADKPQEQWPFLQVRVQLTQPEPGLRARIEAALAHQPVRLVRIEARSVASAGPQETRSDAPEWGLETLQNADPMAYFERLYAHRFGEGPPNTIRAAFRELLNTPAEPGAGA